MDYKKKSKEELIKEIEILKQQQNDILFVAKNVEEMFYKVSFGENGKKIVDYISPQVKEVLGITVEEYKKNNDKLFEHFHPDEIDELREILKSKKNAKRRWQITYRFYNKPKKKYVWLEESVNYITDEDGKKIGIYGSLKDISQKRETEQNLTFILKNIKECLYRVKYNNGKKDFVFVSDQIKNITGQSPTKFRKEGNANRLINNVHPEDLERVQTFFDECVNVKKLKYFSSEFRILPLGKKEYIWISEKVHVKYDANGEIEETTTVLRDITEEKQQQQLIAYNENKFNLLSSATNEVVVIHEDGIIQEINIAAEKMFGYKPSELIGKSVLELAADESKKLVKENILNNYEKPYEAIGVKKDGSKIIGVIQAKVIEWKGKDVRIATIKEITDFKIAQEKLIQSEQQHKSLIDKSPYGILIHRDLEILYINPKAQELLGIYEPSKVDFNEIVLEQYFDTMKERMEAVYKNEDLPFFDYQIKNQKTGKILDIESKSLLVNYEGEQAVQVVFSDITDKKQLAKQKVKTQIAEETNKILELEISERKKIENELLLSKSYTSNIISSSLDIIVATDQNNNIREFNKAAEYVFGYDKEEIIGKKTNVLYKTKKEHNKVIDQLKKQGFFVGEIQNVRKNGIVFTSFLSASQLYDDKGQVVGAMGVSRDITEIKQAEIQLRESEEKYRDLFENATDLIQSLDKKGKILYVNESWLKTLNYRKSDLKELSIYDVIHDQDKKLFKDLINQAFKSKSRKSFRKKITLLSKDGVKVYVEADLSCRLDEKGVPVTIRGILRNITEKRWTEKLQSVYNNVSTIITEKRTPEEMYDALRIELGTILNTDIFVISYALDENTLTFPYYYDKFNGGRIYRPTRRKKGINELFLKYKKPRILYRDDLDKLRKQEKYELLGEKCKIFLGVPLKVKNKVIGVLSVQSYENKHEYDVESLEVLDFISGALALAVQRKYDEQKLFEQTAKLSSIIESSSHLFWTYDLVKGLTTYNQNYYDTIYSLYGVKAELNTHTLGKLEEKEAQAFWTKKYEKAFEGNSVEFTMERYTRNGVRKIYEIFLNPIYDEDGDITEVSGIAHDITEKKIGEEQLKSSLKEKEVLLKEVHHRVKNNLQVISSILNLQSSYVQDSKTLDILRESQNRIKSMSIIHESLYQTNDFSNINFSKYIVSLSKNLVHSYVNFDKFIDLKQEIDDVSLNLDTSIPCGLIVNELVSNALKYAFEGRKKGKITILLKARKDDITLSVADDGVGFPKKLDYRESNSLGLQLVVTLVEQIEGTIEMETNKGTKFTIQFKKD